jgi:hypothetical protein
MNIWRELGLEQTQDLRAIKRAYAKCLKTTRPDEHPEAFQRLYSAYKAALASASNKQEGLLESSADSVDAPILSKEQDKFTQQDGQQREPRLESIAQNLEEQQQLQEYWVQEGERLLNEVKVLLGMAMELHILENWRFLEKSPLILDINFNGQLGVAVFQVVAEHQRLHLDPPLLQVRPHHGHGHHLAGCGASALPLRANPIARAKFPRRIPRHATLEGVGERTFASSSARAPIERRRSSARAGARTVAGMPSRRTLHSLPRYLTSP